MSFTVFIPVRKGSERVKNKNTKKFGEIEGGLLGLKLCQLTNLNIVDEIIVSSNDDECLQIANKFKEKINCLRVIERPDDLGTSTTNLSNLISYAATLTNNEYILWSHVTSPFCDTKDYLEAINKFIEIKEIGFDSLISGRLYKEFLLNPNTNQIVNNSTNLEWPRTQDLDVWFEMNNAIFIASRENYLKGFRTGSKPYLMKMNKISSIDIDDEEDFLIAEAIYERGIIT
jgi:CMP-N-acetylneuraminic acid synthetase